MSMVGYLDAVKLNIALIHASNWHSAAHMEAKSKQEHLNTNQYRIIQN
jgi:hypothetical protein